MNCSFVLSNVTILLLFNMYTRLWCFCVLSQTLLKSCNLFVMWNHYYYFNIVMVAAYFLLTSSSWSWCNLCYIQKDISFCIQAENWNIRTLKTLLFPEFMLLQRILIASLNRRSNASSACYAKWMLESRLNGIILNTEAQLFFLMEWGKCVRLMHQSFKSHWS